MTTDELRSQLLAAPKNGYTRINETQRAEMEAYCKRYAAFMDACKTEREATGLDRQGRRSPRLQALRGRYDPEPRR